MARSKQNQKLPGWKDLALRLRLSANEKTEKQIPRRPEGGLCRDDSANGCPGGVTSHGSRLGTSAAKAELFGAAYVAAEAATHKESSYESPVTNHRSRRPRSRSLVGRKAASVGMTARTGVRAESRAMDRAGTSAAKAELFGAAYVAAEAATHKESSYESRVTSHRSPFIN